MPGNAWNFNRVRFKTDEYENLPTIVRASSNPGDVVLDPFAGSFTTSAVAVRLGCVAVGIELNEAYYEIGLRRTDIAMTRNGKSFEKPEPSPNSCEARERQEAPFASTAFPRPGLDRLPMPCVPAP